MVERLRVAKVIKPTWWAGVYGLVLSIVGLMAAGAGHGTYVPALLFGAPLSVIPVVFIIAPLLWWPYVVYLVDVRDSPHRALVLLGVHAVSVVATLVFGPPVWFGEDSWEYFNRMVRMTGAFIPVGIAVYGMGQAAIWWYVLDRFEAIK